MKTIGKIVKHGNSAYILISDKSCLHKESLKENDLVELDVKKMDFDEKLRAFKCLMCSYQFCASEQELYCPSCDNEDQSLFKEVKGGEQ